MLLSLFSVERFMNCFRLHGQFSATSLVPSVPCHTIQAGEWVEDRKKEYQLDSFWEVLANLYTDLTIKESHDIYKYFQFQLNCSFSSAIFTIKTRIDDVRPV